MLDIIGVSKAFGSRQALRDVSFSIEQGECFGLVGPNGAGKSTLINLITGFHAPDSGSLLLDGTPSKNVRAKIGLVPQEIALYDRLTVFDNLRYFGELYQISGALLSERLADLLAWAGLLDRKKDPVKNISGGMKRRLNLIAGLLHSPELLLVDEPTAGVDPQARLFIYDLIAKLKNSGTTVLYTTHYIPEVEKLCDRMGILDQGRLVAAGTFEEIAKQAGHPELSMESAFFELTGKRLRD